MTVFSNPVIFQGVAAFLIVSISLHPGCDISRSRQLLQTHKILTLADWRLHGTYIYSETHLVRWKELSMAVGKIRRHARAC